MITGIVKALLALFGAENCVVLFVGVAQTIWVSI
jgi:hypothetical protein